MTEPANANIMASNLQRGAVEVDAEQFAKMHHLAKDVMRLFPAIDVPGFEGSLFPTGACSSCMARTHRRGPGGMARMAPRSASRSTTWRSPDWPLAAGCELVEDTQVFPGAGQNGADYKRQLFRAADGRIYAVAQSK